MISIPITKTDRKETAILFSHFDTDAEAGLWKKENVFMLDCIKINLFIDGRFSIFSDNAVHQPIYGDLCVLAPGKMHYGRITSKTHLNYYEICVGESALDTIPDGNFLVRNLINATSVRDAFLRPDAKSRDKVLFLFEEIEKYICDGEHSLAFTKVIELLSLLSRLYSDLNLISTSAFSYHTAAAVKYIEDSYAEKISLKSISEKIGVSASYLSRIFKKETGAGVHTYLNRYRILKASGLLAEHSVTEAAYLCGFSDTSHFISVFKNFMGISPMQHKKAYGSLKKSPRATENAHSKNPYYVKKTHT